MLKPGDLVMIVKPTDCCGSMAAVGYIRTVESSTPRQWIKCGLCGRQWHHGDYGPTVATSSGKFTAQHRLRLIPPLTELESTQTEQAVPVPA